MGQELPKGHCVVWYIAKPIVQLPTHTSFDDPKVAIGPFRFWPPKKWNQDAAVQEGGLDCC